MSTLTESDAIRIARKTLFEAGGIFLDKRSNKMIALPPADDAAMDRADAYNVLADMHARMSQ